MNGRRLLIILIFSILFCGSIFAEGGQSTTMIMRLAANTTTITTTVNNGQDDNIVTAIYAKYAKDSALIGTTLTVTSENGIVTVNGTVTAQSQADEAVLVAKSIAGVKDVRSSITVTTNPKLPQPKTTNY